jgi:hypothetical protein
VNEYTEPSGKHVTRDKLAALPFGPMRAADTRKRIDDRTL